MDHFEIFISQIWVFVQIWLPPALVEFSKIWIPTTPTFENFNTFLYLLGYLSILNTYYLSLHPSHPRHLSFGKSGCPTPFRFRSNMSARHPSTSTTRSNNVWAVPTQEALPCLWLDNYTSSDGQFSTFISFHAVNC